MVANASVLKVSTLRLAESCHLSIRLLHRSSQKECRASVRLEFRAGGGSDRANGSGSERSGVLRRSHGVQWQGPSAERSSHAKRALGDGYGSGGRHAGAVGGTHGG